MKKVLLLPMMLMGVALSFTSCGDNDDPGKDPDVMTLRIFLRIRVQNQQKIR